MAGRNPVPISVLQQTGKKHLTKEEINTRDKAEKKYKPKSNQVKAPEWLDEVAKKEWRRIVKELKELDLVTNIDVPALSICCDAYSKYVKATIDINKTGLLVNHTNKNGSKNIVQNPLILIANKYSEIYKKYCSDFGLTPVARLKLTLLPNTEEEKPTSKWAKFGAGVGG